MLRNDEDDTGDVVDIKVTKSKIHITEKVYTDELRLLL